MPFDAHDLHETLTVLRDAIVLLHRQTIVLGVTPQNDQSFGRPATEWWLSAAALRTFTIARFRHVSFSTSGAIYPSYVLGRDFYGARDLFDLQIRGIPPICSFATSLDFIKIFRWVVELQPGPYRSFGVTLRTKF